MSSKSHHSHHSRSNTKSSNEYTYPSYTTFGTTQTYSSYTSQNNASETASATGSTTRIRVKVCRKRDENGNYLPHKHQHSNNEQSKKHRIVKHKDGAVAGTDVFPESTATHEEIYPVTQSELTNFPTMTTESTSTFTQQEREHPHHHHKGYDREHHKWAVKKRALELLKLNPQQNVPEDQTFTALGFEEPAGPSEFSKYRDVTITTTMAEEMSMIDTKDSTTVDTATDDFGVPIPAKELFPDYISVPRRRDIKVGLADAAVQPEEEPYDPKKEEELRRYVYLSREKIYPKRRRNVMYTHPLPPPPGLEDATRERDLGLFDHKAPQSGLEEGPLYAMPPETSLTPSKASSKSRSVKSEKDSATNSYTATQSDTNTGTHTGTGTGTKTGTGTNTNSGSGYSISSRHKTSTTGHAQVPGGFTSVTELITANPKSAEFVEVSNTGNDNAMKFVEVTATATDEEDAEDEEEEEEEEEIYEEEEVDEN
ncbi:hypothetical protein TVAG_382830 [Trichomonas vaginalis G3]|uniref:Uncharacterized protein n=1 Tax=Trichomonas vaginalis (strain ATCC PRA-98 / G3) TaxID=412133 RepID=A2FJL1_TRIV3|nr:uncharacterized protein TVAGG3_1088260 [Trichomonas vaginalis G3]EAX94898.1 hypothetical protein TVAG_382830 [Trichomonas vaginalis G3]KAI5482408.1 hypothetical protein TVAGG3_1088260 [Trichomonas vaginalis G3]|eukprot:XP_001307828.1 hypothetical protein [Trichomonas vaginalis G3]